MGGLSGSVHFDGMIAGALMLGVASVAGAVPFDIAGPAATGIDAAVAVNIGIDVTLTSQAAGVITDLNIQLLVENQSNPLIHPEHWNVILIHGATAVALKPAAPGAANHLVQRKTWDATFDDEAVASLNPATSFLDGAYIPMQALSAFDGQDLLGDWTLNFADVFTSDQGDELLSWRIFGEFTPVPEPTAISLFGLGLLGLGVARRRKTHPG